MNSLVSLDTINRESKATPVSLIKLTNIINFYRVIP